MKPEEQQFLNDLDKKLWTTANKLFWINRKDKNGWKDNDESQESLDG